ncbi:MAG: TlpA family protein disulfide reductase [SAR324 cluster bacterium]|nr:TlpA family protein disulfide reductase [SAR324 cluster bacterium]
MQSVGNKLVVYGIFGMLLIGLIIPSISNGEADALIGQKAPELSGEPAVGGGLLKVSKMSRELEFVKDAQGKFIEKDGEYVMRITRNIIVLNFFATYCVPCIKEIPAFNRLYQKYRDKAVKLLYVNVDPEMDQAKVQRFIVEKHMEPPMMLPNQQQTMKAYGVESLPRIVIIDRDGNIAEVITGFQADLEQQLSDVIEKLSL